MSTNYTEHYNLCQWEPADKVLREDFNGDNIKLDAALRAIETRLAALEGSAYTTARPQVAAGAYVGNGSYSQLIQTGFRPKAVMVIPSTLQLIYNLNNIQHTYGGYAADGIQLVTYPSPVTIANTGFQVYSTVSGKVSLESNTASMKYFYIAVG